MSRKILVLALTVLLPFYSSTLSAAAEEITIVGTGDGMSILESIGATFTQTNPDVAVSVPPSIGSGGGVKAVGADQYAVGRVAREIKDKEAHFGLSYLPIVRIPVVFFVNKSAGVRDLTAQQIDDIYSGKITNWSEVGGNDGKIRVVRRGDGDSSLGVLRKTFPGFKDVVITDRAKETVTTQENLETVEGKAGTIGFGPYADALTMDVQILTIGGVSATDAGYPSTGTLALIFKESSNKGNMAKFLAFASSPAAHEAIISANGLPY